MRGKHSVEVYQALGLYQLQCRKSSQLYCSSWISVWRSAEVLPWCGDRHITVILRLRCFIDWDASCEQARLRRHVRVSAGYRAGPPTAPARPFSCCNEGPAVRLHCFWSVADKQPLMVNNKFEASYSSVYTHETRINNAEEIKQQQWLNSGADCNKTLLTQIGYWRAK